MNDDEQEKERGGKYMTRPFLHSQGLQLVVGLLVKTYPDGKTIKDLSLCLGGELLLFCGVIREVVAVLIRRCCGLMLKVQGRLVGRERR